MNLVYFILAGAILYVLLFVSNHFIRMLVGRDVVKNWILKVFPLVEFGAWLAYGFGGVKLIFGDLRYYDQLAAFVAILLVLAIAWLVLRDFFAGMLLKIGYRLQVGQHIKTDSSEGQVLRLGNRFIELQQANGARLFIPYSRMANRELSVFNDRDIGQFHHLSIELPAHADGGQLRLFLRQQMMNMPWIIGQSPEIKITSGRQRAVEIKFNIISEEHALTVEEKLRAAIDAFLNTQGTAS